MTLVADPELDIWPLSFVKAVTIIAKHCCEILLKTMSNSDKTNQKQKTDKNNVYDINSSFQEVNKLPNSFSLSIWYEMLKTFERWFTIVNKSD